MSETCPKCGSEVDESWSKIFKDENHIVYKCLSSANTDGSKFYQSRACEIRVIAAQLAAEKALREAAEARTEGLLQHLQHLVDDLDQMCPDSIWSGWWEKALALLAPAPEQQGGGEC